MALPQNAQIDALFEAILKLEDREDCRLFLEDLCTVKEIRALRSGWRLPVGSTGATATSPPWSTRARAAPP